MMAARSNHIELAKYLISKGVNVNAKAKTGDSPLSIAMEEKYEKMIALLEKHGATAANKEKPKIVSKDTTKVMIILDASGSMWGKVEGKPKIQIAR